MSRILAIGGGGFLMEDAPSPIDAHVVALTGKRAPRVCFIGTPAGDLESHITRFHAVFAALGADCSHLAFFRKPSARSVPLAELATHLLAQDAIYVGGGNTKSALAVWREWQLDRVLAQAAAAGTLLCGMSAGALCWFEAGLTDSTWGAGDQPLACLGLLKGGCAVHYSATPGRAERLAELVATGALPATLAIDDGAAALFDAGHRTEVVSWWPGAAAYVVTGHDGTARQQPLATRMIG